MIWEPFLLALVLGLIISAGLYFAYLWPSVEPREPDDDDAAPADSPVPLAEPRPAAASRDSASPAP